MINWLALKIFALQERVKYSGRKACILADRPNDICFGAVVKVRTETVMGFKVNLPFCVKHKAGL